MPGILKRAWYKITKLGKTFTKRTMKGLASLERLPGPWDY